MLTDIKELVKRLSADPYNPEINYFLGANYEYVGQTAAALSFYLRAAEYGERTHPEMVYASLLKIALCLNHQENRNWNVSNSLYQALQYSPRRPEAYYLLSKFYEQTGNWRESHTFAELGLMFSFAEHPELPLDIGYKGPVSFLLQKGISAWWVGRQEESRGILSSMLGMQDIDENHRNALVAHCAAFGISA